MNDHIPDVLYQYLSDPASTSAADLIKKLRFKLSTVGNFNDPFDSVPILDTNTHPEKIKEVLSKRPDLRQGPTTAHVVAEIKARLDRDGADPITSWPRILAHTRILCLSERADGILMWAHYASRHSGWVVGIDPHVLFSSLGLAVVGRVEYKIERLHYGVDNMMKTPEERLGQQASMLLRKSPEWEYEKEVRGVYDISQFKDPNYLPIPAKAIKSIILGSRMMKDAETILKMGCQESGILEQIRVFRTILSPDKFEIQIIASDWRV